MGERDCSGRMGHGKQLIELEIILYYFMSNSNSIVIYHSEMERMQDEFWMEFMASNAHWMQYVIGGVFVLLVLFIFSIFCTTIYNMIKFRKSFKR